MATVTEIGTTWQKHAIWSTYPTRPKFSSVSLYDEPFPRYRSVYFRRPLPWQRSRKLGRVDKNMVYGSQHTPQGPHFHPFRSMMSRFRDTGPFTLDVRYHGNGHGNSYELTKTCYMVPNIPCSPKFSSVSLYDKLFPRYRPVYIRRPLPRQQLWKFVQIEKNMLYGT